MAALDAASPTVNATPTIATKVLHEIIHKIPTQALFAQGTRASQLTRV